MTKTEQKPENRNLITPGESQRLQQYAGGPTCVKIKHLHVSLKGNRLCIRSALHASLGPRGC